MGNKKILQNVDLVILGAVYGKPVHAYNIKKIIKFMDMDKYKWGGFSLPAVYVAIKRLVKKDLIVESGHETKDNFPERNLYKITNQGIIELRSSLKNIFLEINYPFNTLQIAISLMCVFEKEEMIKIAEIRKEKFIEHKNMINRVIKMMKGKVPFTADIIFFSRMQVIDTHLRITENILERVQTSDRFDYIPSRDILE